MRLVVDANVVLSGLLRHGVTRELLLHAPLEFYAPAWLRTEAERHADAVATRAGIDAATVRLLLERVLDRIQLIPEPILARHAKEAIGRCRRAGRKDAPYVACCLATGASLWTHDRRLIDKAGVASVTTQELVDEFLA